MNEPQRDAMIKIQALVSEHFENHAIIVVDDEGEVTSSISSSNAVIGGALLTAMARFIRVQMQRMTALDDDFFSKK